MIDYYGDNQDLIIANAGPGHWNDPDMVRKDEKLCLKFSKQVVYDMGYSKLCNITLQFIKASATSFILGHMTIGLVF